MIHTTSVLDAAAIEGLALTSLRAAAEGEVVVGGDLARRALAGVARLPDDPARERAAALAYRANGTVQRMVGRLPEAEASFVRALAAAERAYGPAGYPVAEVLNDLGMTLKYAGRFDEAREAYARALAIIESEASDPEDLASLYHNLGGLDHARGAYETAEPLARRAIEIRSEALGPRHPDTLLDRSAHAAILDAMGRSEEAEASIRDLLQGLTMTLGADHLEVAVALNNLAAIVQRRGDLAEAERLYRRVLAIRESRLGPDAPALAVALSNLGTVLRAAGRPHDARLAYERALGLLEGALDADHPTIIAIRRNLDRVTVDDTRGTSRRRLTRVRAGGSGRRDD